MTLLRYLLREVQRKPGRMLLTLLGVTLALATVVATGLTIHTVRAAYRDLFAGAAGDCLEVTAPGLDSFPAARADVLADLPGVKEITPRIQGAVGVVGRSAGVAGALVGWSGRGPAGWRLQRGREPVADDEALLDEGLAAGLGLAPGQPMQVWTPGGLISLRLVGTVVPLGAGAGSLVVVSLGAARRLLELPAGNVNSLWVMLEEGAAVEKVRSQVAARLPPGLTVHSSGGQSNLARSTLLAAEQGLTALSAMALVAATFVIFNTFLLNLSERRKHLGLLPTLGAKRKQVLRLLLTEALLLGVAGTIAGCLVGTGLAVVLAGVMAEFVGAGKAGLQLTAGPFLLAGLLGPLASLAAACLPAWQASRIPPLWNLVGGQAKTSFVSGWLIAWPGLLLAAGGMFAVGVCRDWFDAWMVRALLPFALALLLAGGVLAFPLLLPPMLRLLGGLPLSVTGELARAQLARHPTRTGLTAGVLFLALAISIGFGQSLSGILDDLNRWYRQTIVADFLVRAAMPDAAFVLATALPDSLADELAKLPHVAAVDRIAFLPGTGNGCDVLVLARTFSAKGPLPLDLREGSAAAVRQGLLRGEVVLGTGLAAQLGLHRGDDFTLDTPRGPRRLRVAGTASELSGGGSALYLEWRAAKKMLPLQGAHVLLVKAAKGQSRTLRPLLQAFANERRLLLQSNADLSRLIDGQLKQVTAAIWGLLALVFVVASLGVVNTLQMNIHDQVRTFGLLRAVGMKRGQVFRLVLVQALMLGGLTAPPGALAGLGLAWLVSRGSACWAGIPITFHIDPAILLGCSVLALVGAVLAALLPARRAARLAVIDSLG
jgi:putative ABC transport system permease protein